jgi:hypothetical protein
MSLIQKLIDRFRRKPPTLPTQWGDVTEKYRRQAEINLSLDPAKRDAVLRIIAREISAPDYLDVRVIEEARRRYPKGGF